MLTRSAKSKGRRLQQWVREELRCKYAGTDAVGLEAGDIECTMMGESGRDIKLSPSAEKTIPFDIECKNTETASPWAWMEQAKENTKPGRIPLVVFKRNKSDVYCMLKFEDLLKVTK